MPHRSALDLLDDLEMLLQLLRRKILSGEGDAEEHARDLGFIQQYAAEIRRRLERQTGRIRRLKMGRSDEVKFTCDEPGCDANVGFHEWKPPGFVPENWSVTTTEDADGEEKQAYKCEKH